MESKKREDLVNKINRAGNSNHPKYRFQSFVENSNPLRAIIVLLDGSDPKDRLVTEIIRKDSKNFYHHYSTEQDTIKTINQVGMKSDPSFEFVRILPGLNKDRKRVIEVRNIKTGELAQSPYTYLVKKNRNPFKTSKYSDDETTRMVNLSGKKRFPNFCLHKILNETNKSGNRFIEVRNLETNEIAKMTFTAATRGTNPWTEKQDRFEEDIVHPLIFKELKKLKIKPLYHEKFLSKYVKPDFVLQNSKGQILFIEAKTPRNQRRVIKTELMLQKEKYDQFAKRKYKDKYLGTLLVSPDGSNYCSDLSQLESNLKQLGFL